VAGVDALWAQPPERFFEKDAVQLAAVDAQLGRVIAAVPAAQFFVDELAVAVVEHALVILDGDCFELRQHTQSGQLARGVRQQGDADAHLAHFGDALEHFAVHAARVQPECKTQTGNAAAQNGYLHA